MNNIYQVAAAPRRRLDAASLALLLIGLVFGGLSYWLVADHGLNALIVVPSLVAVVTGATHISKREASRLAPTRSAHRKGRT